ncbi:hypothetical protein [Microbacterium hatanonis]|uniref:Alkaline shock response membrane anchor protein AmaP n=1 Tax=Microbacterium hatanonis TaxID=404366 RepID=A0A5C8HWX0_9MICO|nr:hypothetical protein [Microbacterium hatanonis]TXK10368.1 hypothetical protein FVP77_16130 [Microbacterium hatanonis]
MNQTNRALNRILLFLIGLVLLAVGAAMVAAAASPVVGDVWRSTAEQLEAGLLGAAQASPIGTSGVSWVIVGALAAIVIVIVLLIVVLSRLGGGRSRSVLQSSMDENTLGRVVVKDSFASDALTHSLASRGDVVSAKVTAAEVQKETVLHISVTPQRNTSPRAIALEVDRLASNLAVLTGQDIPTYVSIRTGLRARLATEHRELA